MGVTLVPQMMIESELASRCVALSFAPPVPARDLNLLRNPLRVESKAAAAFRDEVAAAFQTKAHPSIATQDSKQ
jgi:DNA-binding transcriptional LysR family regulator